MNKFKYKDDKKDVILKELAKLEGMNWSKDKDIASQIFPYILVDTIELLLNSKTNPVWKDYTNTSDKTKKMLENLI